MIPRERPTTGLLASSGHGPVRPLLPVARKRKGLAASGNTWRQKLKCRLVLVAEETSGFCWPRRFPHSKISLPALRHFNAGKLLFFRSIILTVARGSSFSVIEWGCPLWAAAELSASGRRLAQTIRASSVKSSSASGWPIASAIPPKTARNLQDSLNR